MKQKDIVFIAVIAVISAIVSFVLSGLVFGSAQSRKQTAQVVPVITSSFQQPNAKYFNSGSLDPTQSIQIGPSNNANAFSGSH